MNNILFICLLILSFLVGFFVAAAFYKGTDNFNATRIRDEGYDSAVKDITRLHWYWDSAEERYKNIFIEEVEK